MNVSLSEVSGLAAALGAAHSGGLVAALVERPGSAEELAERCRLDRRACGNVLDVLAAFGLATREGDRYGAGDELAGCSLPIERMTTELWRHAPTFLRSGTPFVTMDASPSEREGLYRDVVPELGRLFEEPAAELASRCGLAPASILDVGCGSGVWSLAFAQATPGARVTGFDLPAVLDHFVARASALGLADRVDTLAGDMNTTALPESRWDLAIIANVLRLEPAERARAIVRRVVSAVRPGGAVIIVDALAAGTPEADRARAIYSLHLALRTRWACVHPSGDIGRWLLEAGCGAPTLLPLAGGRITSGAVGAVLASRLAEIP
jgi:2-polyprenyl-3-methyl-5-hydroxy-6-metoxy-1,4-benzoquinol methylase